MSRHAPYITETEKNLLERLFDLMTAELTEAERLLAMELKDAGMVANIEGKGGQGFALTPAGARAFKEAQQ
tara:strand:+ start:3839 stop:4051 length:213 start_codon:yes stop_codon:yes gene_type:complete